MSRGCSGVRFQRRRSLQRRRFPQAHSWLAPRVVRSQWRADVDLDFPAARSAIRPSRRTAQKVGQRLRHAEPPIHDYCNDVRLMSKGVAVDFQPALRFAPGKTVTISTDFLLDDSC